MKIPVFVSKPNDLSAQQFESLKIVFGELDRINFETRTLGISDYPTKFPLREVYTLARHCSGGVILGFSQFTAKTGVWKHGTKAAKKINSRMPVSFPTPWNQLEAGILFSLDLPLLVFKEPTISGGVFDPGASELFIHQMPTAKSYKTDKPKLREVFSKWSAEVSGRYYSFPKP